MQEQNYRKRIIEGHNELLAAIEGLPPEAFYSPPLFEDSGWTVADVLGHIVTWQEAMLDALDCLVAGREPFIFAQANRMGIDPFNAHKVAINKGRSLQAIMIELGRFYREILRRVPMFTPAELETPGYWPWLGERPLIDLIASNDWEHKHEHTEQIRAWRRRHHLGRPRTDRPETPDMLGEFSLALVRYESEHRRFVNLVAEALPSDLSDTRLSNGNWTCKEIVVYQAAWVEEALKGFETGVLTDLERDREAFRREVAATHAGMSWADALITLQDAHARLVAIADTLPAETIEREARYLAWIDGLSAELAVDCDRMRACMDGL